MACRWGELGAGTYFGCIHVAAVALKQQEEARRALAWPHAAAAAGNACPRVLHDGWACVLQHAEKAHIAHVEHRQRVHGLREREWGLR